MDTVARPNFFLYCMRKCPYLIWLAKSTLAVDPVWGKGDLTSMIMAKLELGEPFDLVRDAMRMVSSGRIWVDEKRLSGAMSVCAARSHVLLGTRS